MAVKANQITAFNAGEMTPLLAGRVDKNETKFGVRYASNFLPQQQGGLKKFYGTKRIGGLPVNASSYVNLVPFDNQFEPMVLCFCAGACYCVTRDRTYLQDIHVSQADLRNFSFKQINDVIYFASKTCPPFIIRFKGVDNNAYKFEYEQLTFIEQPFFPIGWDGNYNKQLYADGYTDTVTLTTRSTSQDVEYSLALPDGLRGVGSGRSVLSQFVNAGLHMKLGTQSGPSQYDGVNYVVGDTFIELVRVRGGVETVVLSEQVGNISNCSAPRLPSDYEYVGG